MISFQSSFVILCSTHGSFQQFLAFKGLYIRRVASNFGNENSRTIQEHFTNISILFKNASEVKIAYKSVCRNQPLQRR